MPAGIKPWLLCLKVFQGFAETHTLGCMSFLQLPCSSKPLYTVPSGLIFHLWFLPVPESSKYIPPLSLAGFGFPSLSPNTSSHPPGTNQTSTSCLPPLPPPAFCPLLAFLTPCWSCGQVSTRGQGLKAHQVCQCFHLAATPLLPASCPGHSITCCGTAV